MVSSKAIYNATMKILKDHKDKLDQWKKEYTPPKRPSVRNKPTGLEVWCRYCHAVVTIQQRISDEFWERLRAEHRWLRLVRAETKRKPQQRELEKLLSDCSVRFAERKAEWLRKAWECDFEGLATQFRQTLKDHHDITRDNEDLRQAERGLAAHIQDVLEGCGVGPKIARLMMIWNPVTDEVGHYFQHVIPIDSRWLSTLNAAGCAIEKEALNTEEKYREIEEEICKAIYKLGFLPFQVDCAVFESFAGEEEE